MRIIFFGTPRESIPCLAGLLDKQYEVVAVICPPDKSTGRGREMTWSPVKDYALRRGLSVYQPPSLRSTEAQRTIAQWKPDLAVVAAYGRLLPKEVLRTPKYGGLNIHPSLLPRHRGPSPVATALLKGDTETGATVMVMDEGMDTGPILTQSTAPIREEEGVAELTERLFHLGASLMLDAIPRWAKGEIAPYPQDDSLATHTSMFSKEDGRIDWKLPAEQIARMVRAYHPWPGAFTSYKGKTMKIIKAKAVSGDPPPLGPGAIMGYGEGKADAMAVVTGQGMLLVLTAQIEGKRPMEIREFLRGQKDTGQHKLGD